MTANVMSMEDIWRKACVHFDVPEPVAKLWYERIYERLNEDNPRRIYHNWNEMMLHKQPYLQHYKPTVVIAAFFQYYEFQGNRCCEGEICETFRQFWKEAEVDDEDAKHLILNLLGNKSLSTHPLYPMESELLQDLDLIILGAPAEDYKRYKDLLRREFAHLADEDYACLRIKVLKALLIISNIYATLEFRRKFEETARQNIKNEIEEWKPIELKAGKSLTSAENAKEL